MLTTATVTGNSNRPLMRPSQPAPDAPDAEQGVLGSCLINPTAVMEIPFLKADDFFLLKHQWIFEAIAAIHERGETVDYLTLIEELRVQNRLNDIGGAAYITLIVTGSYTHVNVTDYARAVARAAFQRRTLELADKIAQHAREMTDPAVLQKKVEAETAAWTEHFNRITAERGGVRRLDAIIQDDIARMKEARVNGTPRGVSTGIRTLDTHLGRLQQSRLYVYAQDTGGGKSVMGLTLAKHAIAQKKRVLYISLEMPEEEHVQRLVAMQTGVSAEKQESVSGLTDSEFKRSIDARLEMLHGDMARYMCIDESPAMTLQQVKTSVRKAAQLLGDLDLLIVDHMQLLHVPGISQDNIALSTKHIFEGMKAIAKTFHIPVWGMAQFNRNPAITPEKAPSIHDIWGGAAAEQAADVVLIGHRPEMYVKPEEAGKPEYTKYRNLLRVYNQKKRGGKSHWMVELTFLPEKTMFADRTLEQ